MPSAIKEKTSVTLSREVLSGIDHFAGKKYSRSAFIEHVLRSYLRQKSREERDEREKMIINQHADELNAEVEDVLPYQDDV